MKFWILFFIKEKKGNGLRERKCNYYLIVEWLTITIHYFIHSLNDPHKAIISIFYVDTQELSRVFLVA